MFTILPSFIINTDVIHGNKLFFN